MATGAGKRKSKKNYAENDDECATSSNDAWNEDGDDEVLMQTTTSCEPDGLNFDSTEGFTLKTIKTMKQSHHVIWNHFGQLMKNGKVIDRIRDRVYCIACFEDKKFKK